MSKETLIRSARELFLKYGIKSVSMDDIARLLGISKKTIYNIVDNKSELVEEVIKDFIKEEEETICDIIQNSKNAIDQITGIAAYVMKSLRKMKPTMVYDLQKYHNKAWCYLEEGHFDEIESTIKQNIRQGIDEGFYRDDLDENIQSKIYVGLVRILIDEEQFPISQYERPYLYKHLIKYHLNGIMNDKGRKELKKYINKENLG